MQKQIGAFFKKLLKVAPEVEETHDFKMFERGMYIHKQDSLSYRVLYPQGFDQSKKYPLLFVLHGSGERGSDNSSQLTIGARLFLEPANREKYPAIVVFPQCSKNGYWSNVHITYENDGKEKYNFQIGGEPTNDMRVLLGAVDEFLQKPYVEKNRVYIGGLSMGGMGALELLKRRPNVFAAAFSVCGGDNPLNAKSYVTKTPLWLFHGELDTVVPSSNSKNIAAAIEKFGGKPKLTIYPNVAHDSWDNAFAEPDLLDWLFGFGVNVQ